MAAQIPTIGSKLQDREEYEFDVQKNAYKHLRPHLYTKRVQRQKEKGDAQLFDIGLGLFCREDIPADEVVCFMSGHFMWWNQLIETDVSPAAVELAAGGSQMKSTPAANPAAGRAQRRGQLAEGTTTRYSQEQKRVELWTSMTRSLTCAKNYTFHSRRPSIDPHYFYLYKPSSRNDTVLANIVSLSTSIEDEGGISLDYWTEHIEKWSGWGSGSKSLLDVFKKIEGAKQQEKLGFVRDALSSGLLSTQNSSIFAEGDKQTFLLDFLCCVPRLVTGTDQSLSPTATAGFALCDIVCDEEKETPIAVHALVNDSQYTGSLPASSDAASKKHDYERPKTNATVEDVLIVDNDGKVRSALLLVAKTLIPACTEITVQYESMSTRGRTLFSSQQLPNVENDPSTTSNKKPAKLNPGTIIDLLQKGDRAIHTLCSLQGHSQPRSAAAEQSFLVWTVEATNSNGDSFFSEEQKTQVEKKFSSSSNLFSDSQLEHLGVPLVYDAQFRRNEICALKELKPYKLNSRNKPISWNKCLAHSFEDVPRNVWFEKDARLNARSDEIYAYMDKIDNKYFEHRNVGLLNDFILTVMRRSYRLYVESEGSALFRTSDLNAIIALNLDYFPTDVFGQPVLTREIVLRVCDEEESTSYTLCAFLESFGLGILVTTLKSRVLYSLNCIATIQHCITPTYVADIPVTAQPVFHLGTSAEPQSEPAEPQSESDFLATANDFLIGIDHLVACVEETCAQSE